MQRIQSQLYTPNEQSFNMIQKHENHQKTRVRKLKKCTIPIFITKTYQILSNLQYSSIISWNNQGLNFIIHNVDRFQQQILPIHFRHRNFTSFVRQLNMYDFHKIRNDHNINIFQHKQFKREQKDCLKNIKRKGYNGIRKSLNQQGVENVNNVNQNNMNNQHQNQHQNQQQIIGNDNNDNVSISDHDQFFGENQSTPRKYTNKENYDEKVNRTIQSIGRISHANQSNIQSKNIIQLAFTPSLIEKKGKLQEFMLMVPDQIQTQHFIKLKIKQLKKDPYFQCLNNKKDIRKLITKLRKRLTKHSQSWDNDLQQLSIEEQIIADKINQDFHMNFNISLAILSTEKMLSRNVLGSMNLMEEGEHLFWRKHY